MEGENRKLLRRVSTPRSPIPTVAARSPRTPSRTKAAATARPEVVAAPPSPKSRRPAALLGGFLAVAGIAGALAIFQPWKGKAPVTEPQSPAAAVVEDSTPQALPSVPAETALSQPAAEEGPPAQATAEPPAPRPVSTPAQRPETTPPARQAPATTPQVVPRLATTQVVRVTGPTALGVGEPAVLDAVPIDSLGHEVPGRRVDWSSSDTAVVSVNRAGAIIGRRAGKAVITAIIDNVTGAIAVTVNAAEQTSVSIAPGQLRLNVGEKGALTASVDGATGRPVDHTIAWSSANPQVATTDASGLVTAHAPGTTVITATAAGHQASASVTVVAPGPSDEEIRAEIVKVIGAYAAALEAKDVAAVRRVYPGMTAERDQQLRESLPNFKGLKVTLNVVEVQQGGGEATATVSGAWDFVLDGKKTELPANNTYTLARRGGWVITDIR
jgi:hypothetical protein